MDIELMVLINVVATAILGIFQVLGNQPKVEAEADVKTAEAKQIEANIVGELFTTISEISADMRKQSKSIIEYIQQIDTCKNDIRTMKDEHKKTVDQLMARITELLSEIAALKKANTDKDATIFELKKKNLEFEKWQKERIQERQKDRGRISALETERDELNETVKQLSDRLEAHNNGKSDKKETQHSEIVAKNDEPNVVEPVIDDK